MKNVKSRGKKSRTCKHEKIVDVATHDDWDLTATWDPTGIDDDSGRKGIDKECDTDSLHAASFAYTRSPRRPRSTLNSYPKRAIN